MKLNHTVACLARAGAVRRAVAAGLALSLAGASVLAPLSAAAAPSDSLEAQVTEAQEKLADLTYELELAQAEADTTALDLADTQDRIAELETQVAETSEQLDAAQADLSSKAAQSYKSGAVTLIDIIFSSSSFDELASRLFYANKVAEAEADRVSTVRELQESLAAQKSELTSREDELTGLLADQSADAAALEAARNETSSYVNGLSGELAEALAAERAAAAEVVHESEENSAPATDNGGSTPADDEGSAEGSGNEDNGNNGGAGNGGATTPSAPSTDPDPAPSTPDPDPAPSVPAGSGNLSQGQRSTIIAAARSQLGCAYDYGTMIPGVSFDCSGLTTYCYSLAGVSIPRSSATQYRTVKNAGNLKTDASQLVAGDLVFYQTGGTIRHVAIYIGGGNVIHASDYSTGVITSGLYYSSGFCGGGSPI
ncbi:NlpC/P60 family protein [Collinsella sp. An307]|uniref:C40 family peptidase n=1 Tax=Collinsella sp. An307 TaxID=1965630 RepID=UPI000B38DD12|nr:NlpC/P60 family protein [Collinsella sp. An307]OUO21654.1 hypothetical protein B5F89_02065 [Collinsella sp. An307]